MGNQLKLMNQFVEIQRTKLQNNVIKFCYFIHMFVEKMYVFSQQDRRTPASIKMTPAD